MSLAPTQSDVAQNSGAQHGLGSEKSKSGMSGPGDLRIPKSLEVQLLDYRRRVWSIKLFEALAIAVLAVCVGFLVVLAMDRWGDTPGLVRAIVLLAVIAAIAIIPWFVYRWVWQRRGLEQLALLLSRKLPTVGDSLLGVLELAHNKTEQSRSPALVQAAIRQVAADAEKRDFLTAVPNSRYRQWGVMAVVMLAISALLFVFVPGAAASALARLAAPWGATPRYTFTRVEMLPDNWFVAHGEPLNVELALTDQSQWTPAQGTLQVGNQQPVIADLVDGKYPFVIPPQIEPQQVSISVGDAKQIVQLEPTLRPELVSLSGRIQLPEYLSLPNSVEKDVRGGTVSLVKGSTARFTATASRALSSASVNDVASNVDNASFSSPSVLIDESLSQKFQWQDQYELFGREPFNLAITAVEDEPPTMSIEGMPRTAVILDSELLTFSVRVGDDYGVKRVGLMWRGLPTGMLAKPAEGERVLIAGGPDQDNMDVKGTFSAASFGIEPQPLELFVWSEDYLPNRPRVVSPPYMLYVLTPDQHAIWMTEQLSKWHRQALEVRDRELQLYETNKELRQLSGEELDLADNRDKIEKQASAERANGRRLSKLSDLGDELIRTASRNPEIGVGHLERWAEMLQVLKDVSSNRMPNVADLLKEAADAPQLASSQPTKSAPAAGNIQTTASGAGSKTPEGEQPPPPPSNPSIVDMESSQNSPNDEAIEPGPPKKPSGSAMRLPNTTVMGRPQKPKDDQPPADKKLDEAVEAQEDLLAEFEKIADELNTILANLEGSTLVKRLKAASRTQYLVAGRITEQLDETFGLRNTRFEDAAAAVLKDMSKKEEDSVQEISYIMDDLAAYFERRRFAQFKAVLDDMKQTDVIGGIRQLTDEIPVEQGLSVAQCEYWSDSLDRWAEDLVDPACNGQCPGGKSPASLPPSIVLEVLQILEAEVNLREETRVAEQAKEANGTDLYQTEAIRLSQSQLTLQERIIAVGERIQELPESEKHFVKELELMAQVDNVMGDATNILARPDTGVNAVAAETEAIELLLKSKRINPKSGGGGGSSPGGGGGGLTSDSALALLGSGVNQKEVREDRGVSQTTGETGTVLPEEFRTGLDEYFNRIEQVNP